MGRCERHLDVSAHTSLSGPGPVRALVRAGALDRGRRNRRWHDTMLVLIAALAFLAMVNAAPLQDTVIEACSFLAEHSMAFNIAVAILATICGLFLATQFLLKGRAASSSAAGERPQNVGILASEVYFPSTFVRQSEVRFQA